MTVGLATIIGSYFIFRKSDTSKEKPKKINYASDPELALLLDLMDQLVEEYAPIIKYYQEMYKKLKTQSIFGVSIEAKRNLAKQLTQQCILFICLL